MIPFFIALVLVTFASAAPTLIYPLQAQFPPVARVGQQFAYNLIKGTFSSSSTITLTSSSLPSWLTFNAGASTFSGTPNSGDVGESVITVTATDSTGSTSDSWTLIVTAYAVPEVHSGCTTQIGDPSERVFSSVTPLPGNTGVSVPPYWSFSLGWEYDTFRLSTKDNNGALYFAARLRGTASLPSWLSFNNLTMTFNGVAPASGSYPIVMTGTDFWGYTGAQSSFVIQVGNDSSLELQGLMVGNGTAMARGQINTTLDYSNVTIGGSNVDPSQVKVALKDNNWPWLSIR